MALAAVAAGADGIIIEVHNDPDKAICDAAQQVPSDTFGELAGKIDAIAQVVGKTVSKA
jgi:3-deoxy-7-phosphoheptulonate synthase